MSSPVALFVYNRVEHTQRTVAALQQNTIASETELIVFSDGAKNDSNIHNVEIVRAYIRTIAGFKQVRIVERNKNFGLAENIINGVTQVVEEFGSVIVLEDDLVTSPHFLKYMNDALNCYHDDDQVVSIHGYIYPVKKKMPETFFIKGADCWGWATWKRGWNLFNRNGQELLDKIVLLRKEREFDFDNSYPYVQMLMDQIAGKNNSWAVRWYASAFLADKYTLYPGRTMVNNIGFDGSGTHCGKTDEKKDTSIETLVKVERVPIVENAFARRCITAHFRGSWPVRLKRLIVKIIKKGIFISNNKVVF